MSNEPEHTLETLEDLHRRGFRVHYGEHPTRYFQLYSVRYAFETKRCAHLNYAITLALREIEKSEGVTND